MTLTKTQEQRWIKRVKESTRWSEYVAANRGYHDLPAESRTTDMANALTDAFRRTVEERDS